MWYVSYWYENDGCIYVRSQGDSFEDIKKGHMIDVNANLSTNEKFEYIPEGSCNFSNFDWES